MIYTAIRKGINPSTLGKQDVIKLDNGQSEIKIDSVDIADRIAFIKGEVDGVIGTLVMPFFTPEGGKKQEYVFVAASE